MKDTENSVKEAVEEKLLAQKIPIDLYWKFKAAAAKRRDTAKEALHYAVELYIASMEDK